MSAEKKHELILQKMVVFTSMDFDFNLIVEEKAVKALLNKKNTQR